MKYRHNAAATVIRRLVSSRIFATAEDPTRPVTSGMDQVSCVLYKRFAAVVEKSIWNRDEATLHILPHWN